MSRYQVPRWLRKEVKVNTVGFPIPRFLCSGWTQRCYLLAGWRPGGRSTAGEGHRLGIHFGQPWRRGSRRRPQRLRARRRRSRGPRRPTPDTRPPQQSLWMSSRSWFAMPSSTRPGSLQTRVRPAFLTAGVDSPKRAPIRLRAGRAPGSGVLFGVAFPWVLLSHVCMCCSRAPPPLQRPRGRSPSGRTV